MIHHIVYFWCHFLYYTKTKKNVFEKSNNFNKLDIYAVVIYFIVHFNT